jgi:hypothetical protein
MRDKLPEIKPHDLANAAWAALVRIAFNAYFGIKLLG